MPEPNLPSTVLVLGNAADCLDYLGYAKVHGIEVRFLAPPALEPHPRETWSTVMATATAAVDLTDVDDVIAFNDRYQPQLELVRKSVGLPTRDIDALLCLADKSRFKAQPAVRDQVVRHVEVPLSMGQDEALEVVSAELTFPVVLKPSNGFYSAGVIRVDGPEAFGRAFRQTRRVCGMLREHTGYSLLLAEEYLDGPEYAVDGVISAGQVNPLLLHRKRPPLTGPNFHETAYLTEPFAPGLGGPFVRSLESILTAVGLDESFFHAEFRFDAIGRLHVLEIAPRLSGGGATTHQLMKICLGLDAYGLLHRLGREQLVPVPVHSAVGLEFDAPVRHSGFLHDIGQAVRVCESNGAVTVLTYRDDGEYLLAPPLNFETVLTAFFARNTRAKAEELLDVLISQCVIQTRRQPR